MFSVNTPKNQNLCKNGDGEGKSVGKGYDCPTEESLRSLVDNALMLVTQGNEGISNPVEIHGGSAVAKKAKERMLETEKIKTQPSQPSLHLFTTDFKPRLRWTTELHARFVDALNELGGHDKVTPKRLQDAMGIEGLEIRHIKSHLQKYRSWKASAKEWPQVLKISGSSIGSPTSYQTLRAYEYNKFKNKCQDQGNNVKKINEMHEDGRGQLYQETSERIVHQHNGEENAAGMLLQGLAGVVTTPSSCSNPETKHLKNNTPEKIKECISFQQKISSAVSSESQKVAHSATAGFIDSQGNSFLNNLAHTLNVQVLLQDEGHTSQAQSVTDGLQSQLTVNSATNDFPNSIVNYSENMAYLQDSQLQSSSFCFEPHNTSYDYQHPSAAFNFQAQNASYDCYQPRSAAISNQLHQDTVFECLPQAGAYGYQPQNDANFAPSYLPNSKGMFPETAYLDDLNAAFAATGNTSMEAINFDPVKAYLIWDDPEPNSQDNGISFTEMREQSDHHRESLAAEKQRTK